jgi:tryptophanyl-tRNA synthetase
MALDNPTKKMSKSEPAGAVMLLDDSSVIRRKVLRAVTDSVGVVRFNPEQEGLYNLLTMIQTLGSESTEEIERRFAGQGYRAVKEDLAERLVEALRPLQERYHEYERQPEIVDGILREGAQRAAPMARGLVDEVQDRLGLRREPAPSSRLARPAV